MVVPEYAGKPETEISDPPKINKDSEKTHIRPGASIDPSETPFEPRIQK